jgi:hypothetical protein
MMIAKYDPVDNRLPNFYYNEPENKRFIFLVTEPCEVSRIFDMDKNPSLKSTLIGHGLRPVADDANLLSEVESQLNLQWNIVASGYKVTDRYLV